jgi:hypothetical protein
LEILTHPTILAGLGGLILFQVHRYNAFKNASANFRSVFLNELEGLYPTPTKWPAPEHKIIYILKDKFPKLEVAVAEFRPHLNWLKRKRFDLAWQKYHYDYSEYYPHTGKGYSYGVLVHEVDTTKTYKASFKNNVDALLKFAKQP